MDSYKYKCSAINIFASVQFAVFTLYLYSIKYLINKLYLNNNLLSTKPEKAYFFQNYKIF